MHLSRYLPLAFLTLGASACTANISEPGSDSEPEVAAEAAGELTAVLTNADMPSSTVTDGAHVYFTAWNSSYKQRIYRVPVNGGTKQSLVGCGGCGKIAIDASYVYFNNGAKLFRIPKGGGTKTVLAVSATDAFADMVVKGKYLYFAGPDGVKRVLKSGGTVKLLSSKAGTVRGLAVDSSYVYWVNIGSGGMGSIRRVPRGSGATTTLLTASEPFDLVVDSSNLYWTNLQGLVWRANKNGTNPWPVADGQNVPTDLAQTGTHLFWTTEGGAVRRMNKSTLAVSTLASGQGLPESITVYGSRAYWANYWGDQVMRATF